MKTELIEIKKQFGTFQALKGINLTIEDGEFVAIVGPSGCGKTTLLRLLAGFETPSDGQILMQQEIVASKTNALPPEKRNIGLVFQSFALWPHMKVKEQVMFPLKHHRFVRPELKKNSEARVTEMLNIVGLSHLADRMPSELSGGQKQRVAIARALSASPSLLLMDEPLSSLDAKLRVELRNEIQLIHQKIKTSIVYVTHDQSEALAMADKIVVMKDGLIEQIGTPEEIYFYPQTEFVASFISKANLIEGSWNGDYFSPSTSPSTRWYYPNVADSFKQSGVCPVRPEQLQLSKDSDGLCGEVKNLLFQGREVSCIVNVNGKEIHFITGIHNSLKIGDHVTLNVTNL
ncbi:ABC transporter ATP-binding protein [Lysinibacillus telephonicus]|uniref:ABC transporter ATP-binding protein n=1 Tax=Lysinibacillus telephonicus TaxID=1714840 RepID=A0A431UPG2_9BACI|nr:ABC transporter ATP-binding protein [Lysinibacillus telephonicus]RTQ91651.1 ABC transporter ATP-binding protein [Lysinibacillus telephonicus]